MTEDEVLAEFRAADALLEGHFVLSSGKHSANYLQCARVLMNAERAGKLAPMFPSLTSLSVAVNEMRAGSTVVENRYVKRVVVAHAAALFEFPCTSSSCHSGGYDLTFEILAGLRSGQPQFEGVGRCQRCDRQLRYDSTVTYAVTGHTESVP